MRGHFGHEVFDLPPHFGPWGRGFAHCGRRPFSMSNWTDSIRSRGPPGFNHGPDRFGNPHAWHRGPPPPPNRGCQGRLEEGEFGGIGHGYHGCGSHSPPGHHHHSPCCECNSSKDHHGPPGFGRQEDSNESDCHPHGCRRRGPPDGPYGPFKKHDGPECDRRDRQLGHGHGPYKKGHHHHHDHGYRNGSSDLYDWFGFGPDCGIRHQCYRRPGPYDRPGRRLEKGRRGCQSNCNKEDQPNREECGKHDKRTCNAMNKNSDQTENTVLVQRIVVERTPIRPQSV